MELGPQDPLVGERPKKDFDRIQGHPLCANGVDGVPQADEQPVQIIFAGFVDLGALHPDVIYDQLLFPG